MWGSIGWIETNGRNVITRQIPISSGPSPLPKWAIPILLGPIRRPVSMASAKPTLIKRSTRFRLWGEPLAPRRRRRRRCRRSIVAGRPTRGRISAAEKMSKKKSGSTMTLKDFHGGSIPSDLPLPSAPGVYDSFSSYFVFVAGSIAFFLFIHYSMLLYANCRGGNWCLK